MGVEGDIIRLEVEVIRHTHFRALTAEQWIAHYAPQFRREVERILKKEGKLPTADRIARELQ